MLFLCRSPNVAFRPISRMLLHVKTLPGAAIMNYPPTSVFHCTCSHMGIMKCTEITGALDTAQFCEVIVFLSSSTNVRQKGVMTNYSTVQTHYVLRVLQNTVDLSCYSFHMSVEK